MPNLTSVAVMKKFKTVLFTYYFYFLQCVVTIFSWDLNAAFITDPSEVVKSDVVAQLCDRLLGLYLVSVY